MNKNNSFFFTSNGEARGYIQPESLKELWIHTGTKCNLSCPFCFEGSSPTDTRIDNIKLDDIKEHIFVAICIGVKRISFTGGEPFFNKNFIDILDYTLDFLPCLVLTNGTSPMINSFDRLLDLKKKKEKQIEFRISLDYPNKEKHDLGRGKGSFDKSIESIKFLSKNNFKISIARISTKDEKNISLEYNKLFESLNLKTFPKVLVFPDLCLPFNTADNIPEITENCMKTYKTSETREQFMCNYTKMILKKNNNISVYPCTLMDDSDDFDLGSDLKIAMQKRIILKHHRCFSCFSTGVSCGGK